MLFEKNKVELQDEIIRLKEMDYFKYHSFLNSLDKLLDKNLEGKSDREKEHILEFTKDIIKSFSDIYGYKRMPEDFRKAIQEIIILKDWNFN